MPLKDIYYKNILNDSRINYHYLSMNPALPLDFMDLIKDKLNWNYISYYNKNITSNYVKQNLDLQWCWNRLTLNLSDNDIINNCDLPWDYNVLSHKDDINLQLLKLTYQKSWNYICVSKNKTITLDFIKENPQIPWNYIYVSQNKNLTLDFVKENLDKDWNWNEITSHKNITFKMIKDNPELPWHYDNIHENINITYEDILENPDIFWGPWGHISQNINIFEIPQKKIRHYFAVKLIWRYWYRAITDPEYTICRKRLLREVREITNKKN